MKAFKAYSKLDPSFWSFVRYVSENLGYSKRGSDGVKSYTEDEIRKLCRTDKVQAPELFIKSAAAYSKERADLLNTVAKNSLMNAETAEKAYAPLEKIREKGNYLSDVPLNKQSGSMKKPNYFTGIINTLAEKTIRGIKKNKSTSGFNDNPRRLAYITDKKGAIIGASSRRFDGAYPDTMNPIIVWEIKEYYYATTFGSRVADGVYETQLDGYEFRDLYQRTGRKVYHVLFIDGQHTWWDQGRSYLCRLIDAINTGIVDEVIVGKEVFERWPDLLKQVIQENA